MSTTLTPSPLQHPQKITIKRTPVRQEKQDYKQIAARLVAFLLAALVYYWALFRR